LPGIQIIHVTEGSPLNPSDAISAGFSTREAYAEARQQEANEALSLAGVPAHAVTNLHFTDQQVCAFHSGTAELPFRNSV
jgi:LmbE family N-acetylglucosaminyl deacetylase